VHDSKFGLPRVEVGQNEPAGQVGGRNRPPRRSLSRTPITGVVSLRNQRGAKEGLVNINKIARGEPRPCRQNRNNDGRGVVPSRPRCWMAIRSA
jgi:hypothetical protein